MYKKEKKIIDKVEIEFQVEKELLALMELKQICKYLGKMDIISSLQHLVTIKEEVNFLQMNF